VRFFARMFHRADTRQIEFPNRAPILSPNVVYNVRRARYSQFEKLLRFAVHNNPLRSFPSLSFPFVQMSILKAPWTLTEGARPLLWSGTLLFSCLLAVSFSTNTFNRWIVFFSFVVPAAYNAFQTSDNLSPDDTLNDIYLRFVIILSSHVTYLCFNPSVSICPLHNVMLSANT
jgi:hypothetical protein